jgi:alkylation response protein AidB-like acyl-CoA dehydrogenase
MDLTETDEQQFLREAVRGAIEREAPLSAIRGWVLGETIDHQPAAELAIRQGWTGIGVAEELGGQGGGALELAILAEELGRGAVPADGLYATILTAVLLAQLEDPEARRVAGTVAAGEKSAALVCDASRPLDASQPGGRSRMLLGAADADLLAVFDGAAVRLVEKGDVSTRPLLMVDRTRGVAEIAASPQGGSRLGVAAQEQHTALAATAAVLIAADGLGAAERMLELTVEYVRQRVQFGVPVGSFQAVKHGASEMLVAIEGTRAVVQYAAWAVGVQEPGYAVDAWVAKARSARACRLVADRALFLHGAVGYTWEHDLQLPFKRAKSDAVLFGGPEVYEERIAAALDLLPA